MDEFSSGYQGRKIQDARLREWPLLDYAARFCGLHLKIVENDLDLSARNLLHKLLSTHILPNGGNFGSLVGTVWRTATQDSIQTTKPLYFAASYGLVSVVRLLLSDVPAADLEARGGRFGSSPLQVASFRGNRECVRLLLAAGADPNSTNRRNETSLYWARHNGSVEIVDLLRSYGAKR
jgi:ankyrin repeat protein